MSIVIRTSAHILLTTGVLMSAGAQWGQIPYKVAFSYSPHVLTKKYRACNFKHSDPIMECMYALGL